jgi:hypothetical protein
MSESVHEKGEVATDDKQSQEPSTPTLSATRTKWTTTRIELCAFYVYYIAS